MVIRNFQVHALGTNLRGPAELSLSVELSDRPLAVGDLPNEVLRVDYWNDLKGKQTEGANI